MNQPPSTEKTGPQKGDVIDGNLEIDGVIAEGRTSSVVSAIDRISGQKVAVKIARGGELEAVERFRRAARGMAKLRSPYAVRVLRVGETQHGLPCMSMEYLEGRTLAQKITQSGPLPIDEATRWTLQACEAVEEAHGFKLLHRDLDAENLFLAMPPLGSGGQPSVRVLDFGLAPVWRIGKGDGRLRPGDVPGTSFAMAPELAKGSDLDERVDVWGMGAVLFRLLTNKHPYSARNLAELCTRILAERPPDVSRLRADVPQGLADVVRRCLEREPADRFPSMRELMRALEETKDEAPLTPQVPTEASKLEEMRLHEHLRMTPMVFRAAESIGSAASIVESVYSVPSEALAEDATQIHQRAAATPSKPVSTAKAPPDAFDAAATQVHKASDLAAAKAAMKAEAFDGAATQIHKPLVMQPPPAVPAAKLPSADSDDEGATQIHKSIPLPKPAAPSPSVVPAGLPSAPVLSVAVPTLRDPLPPAHTPSPLRARSDAPPPLTPIAPPPPPARMRSDAPPARALGSLPAPAPPPRPLTTPPAPVATPFVEHDSADMIASGAETPQTMRIAPSFEAIAQRLEMPKRSEPPRRATGPLASPVLPPAPGVLGPAPAPPAAPTEDGPSTQPLGRLSPFAELPKSEPVLASSDPTPSSSDSDRTIKPMLLVPQSSPLPRPSPAMMAQETLPPPPLPKPSPFMQAQETIPRGVESPARAPSPEPTTGPGAPMPLVFQASPRVLELLPTEASPAMQPMQPMQPSPVLTGPPPPIPGSPWDRAPSGAPPPTTIEQRVAEHISERASRAPLPPLASIPAPSIPEPSAAPKRKRSLVVPLVFALGIAVSIVVGLYFARMTTAQKEKDRDATKPVTPSSAPAGDGPSAGGSPSTPTIPNTAVSTATSGDTIDLAFESSSATPSATTSHRHHRRPPPATSSSAAPVKSGSLYDPGLYDP